VRRLGSARVRCARQRAAAPATASQQPAALGSQVHSRSMIMYPGNQAAAIEAACTPNRVQPTKRTPPFLHRHPKQTSRSSTTSSSSSSRPIAMGELKGGNAAAEVENGGDIMAISEMSTEPQLWVYKQLIVVLVLTALAIVVASPFTSAGWLLWYLVFFTSINLFNALGQTARMISAVGRIRARVVPRKPLPKGGSPRKGEAERDGEAAYLLTVEDAPAWHHVFVIPNYREDLDVLRATLDRLASHRHAPHYTIVLAMEEKEAYAEQKASQLQEQYCLRFKAILFTLHSLDPVTEMPGKASNVNAAVRQFAATVPAAERARYMLTIIDADALVPPAYVAQLESTTAGVGASAADHIYAAPVMFEQNSDAIPALVKLTDYTWGALAMQNLNNWSGIGFPISNYSLSLALVASIGFWDTW